MHAHSTALVDEPTREVPEDLIWDRASRALAADEEFGDWIFLQGDRLSDTPGDVDTLGEFVDTLADCRDQSRKLRAASLGDHVTVTIPDVESSLAAAVADLAHELGTSRCERLDIARRLLATVSVEANS